MVFEIVVKLRLLFEKNSFIVVCVDRLVQSGTVPSQYEREFLCSLVVGEMWGRRNFQKCDFFQKLNSFLNQYALDKSPNRG